MWKEGHSEGYIKRLAKCGCTNINTHFFKGFGLEVEADHIEELKRLVKLCHRYGIKVNGYIQFGTIVPETILDEVPEAADWPRRNPSGEPITMGRNNYRWRPCYSHQGFIDYIKKCITLGVKEVGLDGIFLDNTSIVGCLCQSCVRYEGCWCEECQEGFAGFLRGNTRMLKPFSEYRLSDELKFPRTSRTVQTRWSGNTLILLEN